VIASGKMSQMLQLDALVMAMACLSTTQTDLGGGLMVPPSLQNAVSCVRASKNFYTLNCTCGAKIGLGGG